MTRSTELHPELKVAATLAGEDVACGQYVAVLNETVAVPSYMWDGCGSSLPPQELVRLKIIPDHAGVPLKVVAVCLPFVYVKTPSRAVFTIDTRRVQLVRLDRRCARLVWKQLRRRSKRR